MSSSYTPNQDRIRSKILDSFEPSHNPYVIKRLLSITERNKEENLEFWTDVNVLFDDADFINIFSNIVYKSINSNVSNENSYIWNISVILFYVYLCIRNSHVKLCDSVLKVIADSEQYQLMEKLLSLNYIFFHADDNINDEDFGMGLRSDSYWVECLRDYRRRHRHGDNKDELKYLFKDYIRNCELFEVGFYSEVGRDINNWKEIDDYLMTGYSYNFHYHKLMTCCQTDFEEILYDMTQYYISYYHTILVSLSQSVLQLGARYNYNMSATFQCVFKHIGVSSTQNDCILDTIASFADRKIHRTKEQEMIREDS